MSEANYLSTEKCYKTFLEKSEDLQEKINEALFILEQFGISIKDKSPRLKEKIALGFLSLGDMNEDNEWNELKDITETQRTSRDIIKHQNDEYGENRSSGSYDDVRREDIKELVLANIVLNTKPKSAKNDPTRKYGISKEYAGVARTFGTNEWDSQLKIIVAKNGKFVDRTSVKREFEKVPITLPDGITLNFSVGEHNELQKAIIEEFLPRYCPGGDLLYLGDSEDKDLINENVL